MGILGEYKKSLHNGLYILLLVFLLIPISFQVFLTVASQLKDGVVMHIAILSLFCRLFLPIAIGLLVSFSFVNEFRRKGYMSAIYHGITLKTILSNKFLFCLIITFSYLICALVITSIPIVLTVDNLGTVYQRLIFSILFMVISSLTIVNLHFLINIIFYKIPLLSLLVGVIGGLGSFFISRTNYWILFPWSYPIMSLYFESIEIKQLSIVLVVYLLSLMICIFMLSTFYNKKTMRWN
ncbi:ABC transporter permease [Bacillus cereus]|uniref:ABC transporter permease n=1 Tax=Bacillus cereus TaxID=1396 RepID=UPI0022F16AD9|nr:ABC transporter permease [Bacillus cereus]MDA2548957.1 ABC transporter permease [Bacillus cereus]MDA2553730.1 ABC transporter permease [Bacillus cereus]WBV48876.1 ABC transporter permease [Bacillus cereus]